MAGLAVRIETETPLISKIFSKNSVVISEPYIAIRLSKFRTEYFNSDSKPKISSS